MRRELGERLGEGEVVGEFGSLLLLAAPDAGLRASSRPHLLAQRPDQVGVLGEPLDQDGTGTVQRCGDIGDALAEERRRSRLRVHRRVAEQALGQRLQARLAGDLRLGAPLGFVRQVDVLQAGLRVGGEDLGAQRVVQLALRLDRLQDRLLQVAQLCVVERPGGLLAIPGDERDGCPAVEQLDGHPHLPLADPELFSDLLVDGQRSLFRSHRAAFILPGYGRLVASGSGFDDDPPPGHRVQGGRDQPVRIGREEPGTSSSPRSVNTKDPPRCRRGGSFCVRCASCGPGRRENCCRTRSPAR